MNPEIVSFQYATVRLAVFSLGGSEQHRSVIANVQSDDLWPSRMHAATNIPEEKTHACGVLCNISVVFLRHSVHN